MERNLSISPKLAPFEHMAGRFSHETEMEKMIFFRAGYLQRD
jgi:hypothetical protein